MPKADELDKAGLLLNEAASQLKKLGEGFGSQMGKRATSVDAVFSMLASLAESLAQVGDALGRVGNQLRTAAAELESQDEE